MLMTKRFGLLSLLLLTLGCSTRNPRVLPNEVVGFWTTDAISYKGRSIDLMNAFVIVGAGDRGSPSLLIIDRVEVEPSVTGTTYTIYSTTTEHTRDQLSVQFDPRNGGELHFKNQPGVSWRR
jgi:hypothetical protein